MFIKSSYSGGEEILMFIITVMAFLVFGWFIKIIFDYHREAKKRSNMIIKGLEEDEKIFREIRDSSRREVLLNLNTEKINLYSDYYWVIKKYIANVKERYSKFGSFRGNEFSMKCDDVRGNLKVVKVIENLLDQKMNPILTDITFPVTLTFTNSEAFENFKSFIFIKNYIRTSLRTGFEKTMNVEINNGIEFEYRNILKIINGEK